MPLGQIVLADGPATLERCLRWLDDLDVVGVDVERADWKRYWRAAALVQVGGDGRVALLDPLSLDDLSPLQAFLSRRVAVLHAMENDLGPLAALGVVPARIEDTGIAAALLGLPTGLETLQRDLLGVELTVDKQAMQRADWETRPLRADMLAYAAGDVADLPALWQRLHERLAETGRQPWYEQELAAALVLPPAEQRREWTRTKGIGRLDAAARTRLRALWNTREHLARSTNTAPGRIVGDRILVDLATTPPSSAAELGRRGVRRQAARSFGGELMGALAAGDRGVAEPGRRDERVATDADRAKAEQLRTLRAARARELGIDPGVLCASRTLLTALLSDPASPAELQDALGLKPWQWEQLGAAFCAALGLDGPGAPPVPAPRRPQQAAPSTTRPGQAPSGRSRRSTPAKTGAPPMADLLNADALHHELNRLQGWGGTVEMIAKTYEFGDFAEAMAFVNRVAQEAEAANHHPDIAIRWNKVTLELATHSAGGVTQNDIDLARRVEGLRS